VRTALDGAAPFCSVCRSATAHVVSRVPGDPSKGHDWLCGSCEWKRDHPETETKPAPDLPVKHRVPLQKETLF
jgi:hypothetical protein